MELTENINILRPPPDEENGASCQKKNSMWAMEWYQV